MNASFPFLLVVLFAKKSCDSIKSQDGGVSLSLLTYARKAFVMIFLWLSVSFYVVSAS